MAARPTPVEVFGVGSDGELIPLTPGSSPGDDTASARTDADRAWILGPLDELGGIGGESDDGAGGLPSYQARKAHRPGGFGDRPTRTGGREDVVAPVHVLPGPASRALHAGDLFREPLPGLVVDIDSLEVDSRGSTWSATVTCRGIRRNHRKATLRAYPSPSANLTVLELVPTRRRLVQTRAFVKAGVPAIATLCSRISRTART